LHPQKTNIVRQSNKLVEARYNLTLNEQRVILSLISMIHPKDKDFQCYELSMMQLAKLMKIDPKHATRDVENVIFKIQDRVVFIRKTDGDYLRTHWLSSVEKTKNNIHLSFDPKLKPYLLELKEQFTQFQLSTIVQFQSVYTIRLYALLKQYELIGFRKFEVEKLRKTLGIEKAIYPQFKEFKRRVLNQAKKEFEERDEKTGEYKSDIGFDLETKREGRVIKYLIFHIKQQKVQNLILKTDKVEPSVDTSKKSLSPPSSFTSEQTQSLTLLKENGVNQTTAKSLAKKFPPSRIIDNIKLTQEKSKQGKVKNLSALIVTAIRDDWANQTATPLEQIELEKQRDLKAKKKRQAQKAKKIEELKSQFEKELQERAQEIINGWSKQKYQTEIEAFLKQATEYTRRKYRQTGMKKGSVQATFRNYVRKKYLTPEESDFDKWVKVRDYEIDGF
jgi:plasmid replication initiation protein